VTSEFALAATAADVMAITVLAVLSGGAFSEARLAYFLVPISVAFRFRPGLTALASAATVVAYLVQAFVHPAANLPHAGRFVAVQAGYLVWLGLAAVLLSDVLERRTRRVAELAHARQRLIAEAQTAEERQRRELAEGLHDHAIQNLLSARHDLEEVAESAPHPALGRADTALSETVTALREAVFELHPYVLEQVGLEGALRSVARRAARQAGFELNFDLAYPGHHPHERVLLSAARELLVNVARHAGASAVTVQLREVGDELVLSVDDDGQGFDVGILSARLTGGHIGLHSQRERIESVGGRLELQSASTHGTTATIHLPAGR
jgi:two-component system NarL family sensor kinase